MLHLFFLLFLDLDWYWCGSFHSTEYFSSLRKGYQRANTVRNKTHRSIRHRPDVHGIRLAGGGIRAKTLRDFGGRRMANRTSRPCSFRLQAQSVQSYRLGSLHSPWSAMRTRRNIHVHKQHPFFAGSDSCLSLSPGRPRYVDCAANIGQSLCFGGSLTCPI